MDTTVVPVKRLLLSRTFMFLAALLRHSAWRGLSVDGRGKGSRGVAPTGCVALALLTFGQNTNADTWAWEACGGSVAPTNRYFQCAVWTGSELLLWGGQLYDNSSWRNDGYRYEPLTRTWRTMSSSDASPSRYSHTTVWTGREMIMWGGNTSRDLWTRTGARYDPASNTWRPTSTTGAPTGRTGHTAVWTGTEMIIWGGFGKDGSANSGGRYNPATDTWQPTPTLNAPSGRDSHCAVWTGQEMIVWGGLTLDCKNYSCHNEYRATLGRFDPVANRWVTTVVSNAPSLRAGCSAIWNGREMIVWGGYNGSSYGNRVVLKTGGRFDPATEIWRPTSLVDAPTARDEHVALWTGKEMIIWGGNPYPSLSGGRYDPVLDHWTIDRTNGAPVGLKGRTAVWTGGNVLGYQNNLFCYRPSLYANDGIPDEWQERYFGSDNPNGLPAADPDRDQQSNLVEYLAGTDPTSASSVLRIETVRLSAVADDRLLLRFSAVSNKSYGVQRRVGLESGGWSNWLSIAAEPSNRVVSITNTIQGAAHTGFYRLVTPRQQ